MATPKPAVPPATLLGEQCEQALLMALVPLAPPDADALFGRILARVRAPAILTVRSGAAAWHALVPGVERTVLAQSAGATSFLLRMAPGSVLPAHEHGADEEAFCLSGSAMFDDGLVLTSGAYLHARAGQAHSCLRSAHGCLLFVHSGAA